MNLRPSGYEPDELPDCSTPRRKGALSPDWLEKVVTRRGFEPLLPP